MAKNYMTPGVYIEEVNAFPGSVVEVATAIPAFIGYTEKASRNGKSLVNTPVRITSLKEFNELFGGGFNPKFTLEQVKPDSTQNLKHTITIDTERAIEYVTDHQLNLYNSLQLFYANGGSTCYIVSVGTFDSENGIKIDMKQLLGTSEVDDKIIEGGLKTLLKEQEPTIVVIPDAVNLSSPDECYGVYKQVLMHCSKMQSRVAVLDIHRGDEQRIRGNSDIDIIANFREKIGSENLNYAAAYYPWLNTNIVQDGEITFENLKNVDLDELLLEPDAKKLASQFPKDNGGFIDLLIKEKQEALSEALNIDQEKAKKIEDAKPGTIDDNSTEAERAAHTKAVAAKAKFDAAATIIAIEIPNYVEAPTAPNPLGDNPTDDQKAEFKEKQDEFKAQKKLFDAETPKIKALKDFFTDKEKVDGLPEVSNLLSAFKKNKKNNHHLGLVATSSTYTNILKEVTKVANLLPPSPAMAGIYTAVDDSRGVWKSPANISFNSVIKPSANITHDQQENLNVDALTGKSINAIRTFPGIGTLVWGGRTLDGNSLDWKYINVRRTIIMLEQSIKLALRAYVFEPNDANTWVTVKSMIVNFLTDKWKQGALAGATPEDAFDVQIGLGSTMTSLDILEGKMLVSIKLAIVRPAEFIVVTFQQQMQKS